MLLMRMLAAASGYPGCAHTAVVSECSDVLRLADDIGAVPIRQTAGSGLNNAVGQGVAVLRSVRPGPVLVVAADLPLVTTNDLRSIAPAGRKCSLVVFTDKHRTGTNALYLPAGIPFQFQFGPNSCAAHYREGMAAVAATSVLFSARIAFDIDTPEDLLAWRRIEPSPPPNTARVAWRAKSVG